MKETVGQYRILAMLGEGGMGAVYAAEDTLLDIKVAIKALKSELTKQPDLVERFREEAKIQVKLSNPHIVKLYTFIRDGLDCYMVMEFVEGRTLASVVQSAGRLHYKDAILILVQVLDGLEHAHRQGVIHRDIKPANIMLTDEGTVKVMDFGIARVLGSRRLTQAGNIVGTLDYISPEALNGLEITPAADLYSCGIMLYKMITGSLPFISDNDFLLARMHVEATPAALSVHVPEVPRKLDDILLRSLAKKSADRFGTARQMADALERFLEEIEAPQRMAAPAAPAEPGPSFWKRFTPGRVAATRPEVGPGTSPRPRAGGAAAASTATRRIEEFMKQNRMREAMDLVQKSLREDPGDTTLQDLRSRIEREQQHYEEDLRRSAQEIRGYLDRNLPEMALSAIELSLKRYSGETRLLDLLAEANSLISEKQKKSHLAAQTEAEIQPLLKEQRFTEAVAIVVEAISSNPEQPELSALLGRVIKTQRDEEKRKAILKCRAEVENYLGEGQHDLALQRIAKSGSTYPDDPSLQTLLKQVTEARDEAAKRADLLRVISKVEELEAVGQFDEADRALAIALSRFPRERELVDKRQIIGSKIAQRKRSIALESACKRAGTLSSNGEWQQALGEIDSAVADLGPDPQFDTLRLAVKTKLRDYTERVRTATSSARKLIRLEEFSQAITQLVRFCEEFPKDQTLPSLLGDAKRGLEAQKEKETIRSLISRAGVLIAEGNSAESVSLLRAAVGEFPQSADLATALNGALEARRLEMERVALGLRRVAILDAVRLAENFGTAADWAGGEQSLREALTKYPGVPELEKRLHEFTIQAEAQRRAVALDREEGLCRQEVARRVEQNQWDDAFRAIDTVLLKFPEASAMTILREEVSDRQGVWRRKEELNQAVAHIENLFQAGNLDGAAAAIEKQWLTFPEAEIFLTLSERLEQLQDQAVLQRGRSAAAERAAAMVSAHRWGEVEEVLAAAEKRYGSDERLAEIRRSLAAQLQEYQTRVGKSRLEIDRLVQEERWPEAIALAERLLSEYPEASEIRDLLDRTSEGLKAWRRAKELERALQSIQGLIQGKRWVEAEAAIKAGRLRFSESGELFDPLSKLFQDERAKAQRKQVIDDAVRRAVSFTTQRGWAEALTELDKAEAECGKSERVAKARKSILDAQENHRGMVAASCNKAQSLLSESKWEESLRALYKPELEGEPEVERLRGLAVEGKSAADRIVQLQETRAGIAEATKAGNLALAAERLGEGERKFPGEKSFEELRSALSVVQKGQEREAWIIKALAEAGRQAEPSGTIEILRKEIERSGEDDRLREGIERIQQSQEEHGRKIAGIEAEARDLIKKGQPEDAVRYLNNLPAAWRNVGSLKEIARQAEAESGKLTAKKRDAEIQEAGKRIEAFITAGSTSDAKVLARQALQTFPGEPALVEAERRIDAAMGFEARIHQCLLAHDFEGAERAWMEGADFASVAALGAEIERRHLEYQQAAAAAFDRRVRELMAQFKFDEAEREVVKGTGFPTASSLRLELEQKSGEWAAQRRIEECRKKLEQAWVACDFSAADSAIKKAMAEADFPAVQDWIQENERQRRNWDRHQELERLKGEFQYRLTESAFSQCRVVLDRIAKDYPGEKSINELTLVLQQREDAQRAETALRAANELLVNRRWDEALGALANAPAGHAWAESIAQLRNRIEAERSSAQREAASRNAGTSGVDTGERFPPPAATQGVAPTAQQATNRTLVYVIGGTIALTIVGLGTWFTNRNPGAQLTVSPSTLSFNGTGAQTVQVEGSKSVGYTSSGSEAWIWLRGSEGETPGILTVEANPEKLPPGQYRGIVAIQVRDQKSTSKQIEVLLTVDKKRVQPTLTVSPRIVTVNYQVSQPLPAARRLELGGVSPEKCRVRVTKGAEWLFASVGPGAGVTVSFRLAGKSAGSYAGEVEIIVEGGAPVRVPVNLVIQAFRL